MTNLQNLTVTQLRKVVAIKEEIERLEAEMASIGGDEATEAEGADVAGAPVIHRRRMSPAAKARIAAGQRARWAKLKGEAETPEANVKKKRRVSRATRARLAAAATARWARAKAAGEASL